MSRFLLLTFYLVYAFTPWLHAQEGPVYSQHYATEVVKSEQGLSQNSVRSIFQDSRGLMWFGTWDGLNRFNGLSFHIIRSDFWGEPGHLSNHTINVIYEDHHNYLWIGTDYGLNRLDPKTMAFKAYFHEPGNPESLPSDTIKAIASDRQGNLWIGTQQGLVKLVDETGKFLRVVPGEGNDARSAQVRTLFSDSRGRLWIGTAKGLFLKEKNNHGIGRITDPHSNECPLISPGINVVRQVGSQLIMVGTEEGISILDFQGACQGHITPQNSKGQLKDPYIMDLCPDQSGKVWIATSGGGISFYYPQTGKVRSLDQVPGYAAVNEAFVNRIYEDEQGIIWIGYAWKGLAKVVPARKFFNRYSKGELPGEGLVGSSVWAVNEVAPNTFYVATDRGISVLESGKGIVNNLTTYDGLSTNHIRSLLKCRNDAIWVGTNDRGLIRISREKGDTTLEFFGNKANGRYKELYNNVITGLLQDGPGYIWAATNYGLYRFHPDSMSESFTAFLHEPNNTASISHNMVYSVFEDDRNTIWLGTYNGLNKYNRETGVFTAYKHITGDPNSISTNRIFGISQDESGTLWVGTMGGGLNKMDPITEKFSHYVHTHGLANNVVYNIIPDEMGYLWLSTNRGLSRFSPGNEQFVNFDVNDGIQGYEFNLGAAFKSSDEKIFFGGMNGLNSFYALEVKRNQYIPKLVITNVSVYNQKLNKTLEDGDTIILSHKDNFISLEFAALDYTNPVKNQYKYRLKNVSRQWIHVSPPKNTAEFTKLPPGEYEFFLKGSNSDGIWNEQGMRVYIIIEPAWHQTRLFRFGSATLILLLVLFAVAWRIGQIRKEQQAERQIFELERKALRLQMNPHFIFNTLNSIQSFVLKREKKAAVSYLNKFSKMIRQVLYNSDKSFVLLSDEMVLLKNYIELERLRFDSGFDYEFYVDPGVDDDFISIPPMLIQPHVENAILHGLIPLRDKGGVLTVSFLQNSRQTIKCVVDDNGIGREAAGKIKKQSKNKYRSRGISITRERLNRINEMYNHELSVDIEDKYHRDGTPAGTKVTLIIPVKNE